MNSKDYTLLKYCPVQVSCKGRKADGSATYLTIRVAGVFHAKPVRLGITDIACLPLCRAKRGAHVREIGVTPQQRPCHIKPTDVCKEVNPSCI